MRRGRRRPGQLPSRCTAKFFGRSWISSFAGADGVLQISSDDCARLLVEHMPEDNFADAGGLPTHAAADLPGGSARTEFSSTATTIIRFACGRRRSPIRCSCRSIPSTAGSSIARRSTWTGSISSRMRASSACRIDDDPLLEQLEHGRRASADRRCRLLVVGILGPTPGGVLSLAAALWPGDIARSGRVPRLPPRPLSTPSSIRRHASKRATRPESRGAVIVRGELASP